MRGDAAFYRTDHAARRGPKAWVYRQAHRWVNRRAAHFIAISEAVREGILARKEASANRITVVPNGIHAPDPARLTPLEQMRADLGIPLDAPLIVCTARLEREKDIASLIAAMPEALKVFPASRCLIAGQGAQQQALAAQIRTAGLEQAVRLLGFRSDALALMQAADVFVLPSLAEPFGLAILEAMALARPVIATCAGGPLEIVEDGATGLLVPPANPEALAQAISNCSGSRKNHAAWGSRDGRGLKPAIRRLTWQTPRGRSIVACLTDRLVKQNTISVPGR